MANAALDPQDAGDLGFPSWLPWASAATAVTVVGVAVADRLMHHYGGPIVVAWGVLAVAPFVLDALVSSFDPVPKPHPILFWLFPLPVFAGVALLIRHPTPSDFTPFVLVFLTAEMGSRFGAAPIGFFTAAGGAAVMVGAEWGGWFDGGFIWLIGIVFGWFAGFMINALVRTMVQLKEAQGELTTQAASDERQRIAREVHDVIAHTLTVTMLNVTAGRMAAERGDNDDASEALREAERLGRQSLADIRRTVGLLGSGAATAPALPTAASIADLVGDFQRAGISVSYDVAGDLGDVPPATGLALYRVAQESLGNAAKHAPEAAVCITLGVHPQVAVLEVSNALNGGVAAPSEGGHGIAGMNERIQALGGTLSFGPDDRGWTVRATVPLD